MKEIMIKHKIPIIIIAAILLAAMGFAAGMLAKTSLAKDGDYIGAEKARTVALESVGVSSEKATFTKAEMDEDDGVPVYELEFYTGVNEYEFEIDALTGEILEKKSQAIRLDDTAQSSDGQAAQTSESTERTATSQQQDQNVLPTNSTNYIGVDKAKSIALSQVGVSPSNASFTKVHLDSDDDTQIYEIEFITQDMEYDCEINAYTGEVLECGRERLNCLGNTCHGIHHNQNCWN